MSACFVDPCCDLVGLQILRTRAPKPYESLLRHVGCLLCVCEHAPTLLTNKREVTSIQAFDVVSAVHVLSSVHVNGYRGLKSEHQPFVKGLILDSRLGRGCSRPSESQVA